MGTIAEKLEYLDNTREKIKDSINLTGVEISNQDTFRSYSAKLRSGLVDIINNGTDELYDNFPKVTGSGNDLTLENTYEAPMKTTLYGNTEQDSTTGKNLYNYHIRYPIGTSVVLSGVRVTYNSDDTITLDGTLIDNNIELSGAENMLKLYVDNTKNYYILVDVISGSFSNTNGNQTNIAYECRYNSENNVYYREFKLSKSTTSTQINVNGTEYLTRIRIWNNTPVSQVTFDNFRFRIALYENDNTINWEPYTGGISSPNPEYPQNVRVVTGRNEVEVKGKNLFNNTLTPSGLDGATATSTSTGIKVTSTIADTGNYTARFVVLNISDKLGQTMTLSSDVVCSSSNYGRYAILLCDENEGNRNYFTGKTNLTTGKQELTITIPTTINDNNEYLMIALYSNSGSTAAVGDYVEYNNLQLEFGSATPFEPYQSNNYEVNLGNIELCKIGTYKDKIYKENNKWYLRKEVGKVVLESSNNWQLESSGRFRRYADNTILPPTANNVLAFAICNYFSLDTASNTWNNNTDAFSIDPTSGINIRYDTCTTLEELSNWLAQNKPVVYYVLATPTTTEITNTELIEQLEALYNAKSCNDRTYITANYIEGNVPLELDAVALLKEE